MTIEQIINNNFKNLDWDSTAQAYYRLDFTPFMEIIYDSAKEYAKIMCEKQKEICAENEDADYQMITGTIVPDIEVYVLKQSILQCKNAIDL